MGSNPEVPSPEISAQYPLYPLYLTLEKDPNDEAVWQKLIDMSSRELDDNIYNQSSNS